jgi:tetratricopeptide (TPR) repeat protein
MKRALLAGAVIAASLFTPSANAAVIVIVGRGPALDCYMAAHNQRRDRDGVELCTLALDHDFLTREDRAATYVNRGIIQLRRGQTERALADLDDAVAVNSELAEAYVMRGAALVSAGRHQEAIADLTHALTLNPDHPERVYFYRAGAYEEVGNARAAYNDYRRAAELAPDWRDPTVELARFQVRER